MATAKPDKNPKRQAAAYRRMAEGQRRASLVSIAFVIAGVVGVAVAHFRDWHELALAVFALAIITGVNQYSKHRSYLKDFREKLAELESRIDNER